MRLNTEHSTRKSGSNIANGNIGWSQLRFWGGVGFCRSQTPRYLGRAETALEFHGHVLLQVVHPLVLQVLQGHLAPQLGHFL